MKLRLAKASQLSWNWGLAWLSLAKMMTFDNIPGDPKKSILLFGVSWEKQVSAKQLNRHIFG